MTNWIDPIQPDHDIVPYKVVAAASGVGPYGPTGRTVQGNRLPVEIYVPSAGMERQHRQVAASTGAAQINRPVLVTDPKLADFDLLELGQDFYEDGTEIHRRPHRESSTLTMRGVSSRNLCRNEADSDTYCSVRRRHSITASDAANPFTSGSWTLR